MRDRTRTAVTVAATLALALIVGGLGAVVVVGRGLYDVGATRPHWQLTHRLLETAMRQSVRWRARDVAEPPLDDDDGLALRGAACFAARCVQCHGAPGVAQHDIGQSMQPIPGPLVDARRHWRARELYWVTRHGIKMSGMPAWQHRLADADLWAIVAFLQRLPDLDAGAYARWVRRAEGSVPCGPDVSAPGAALPPPDAERGRRALPHYACHACHTIPGVTSSQPLVGPPLAGIGRRALIAGVLPNGPQAMATWLLQTQTVKPGTAMPEMGLTPRDAQDIAAFLATLR